MEHHRVPGGAPSFWAIIDNVADAIGSIGASGEPELRVYDDESPAGNPILMAIRHAYSDMHGW